MRSLSAGELLDVWEHGLAQLPVERALSLLTAGFPDTTEETCAQMPLGERDSQLLMLRERIFGPALEAIARCPACGELLETTIDSSQIRIPAVDNRGTIAPVERDGYLVRFRPADSTDLAAIEGLDDAEAKGVLLKRCCTEVTKGKDLVSSDLLPEWIQDAVLEAMDAADPQANTLLHMTCPSCGREWQERLDILSFFWDEIGNWAERTLDEVHGLALAYGWSEPEILSMSAARRQMYLEKVVE